MRRSAAAGWCSSTSGRRGAARAAGWGRCSKPLRAGTRTRCSAKVDTQAQPELAAAFGISSIPTLIVIRDSVVLYAEPGALPEPVLEQLISTALEIDMDEVRKSLAEPVAS